jgi:hypothetical protein
MSRLSDHNVAIAKEIISAKSRTVTSPKMRCDILPNW